MKPQNKFDFVVQSTVLRGEKANKALEAFPSANEHQMNRLVGYLPDGRKVVVAQRGNKAGVDFTKLMGGKVFAVAADAVSPVYEKVDGKATKTQKLEDGLPLFSANGFYLLSSKDYPAQDIWEAYTRLNADGTVARMVTDEQLAQSQTHHLSSDFDCELLQTAIEECLSDERNLVAVYDAAMNKKRERRIQDARRDAEDANETYSGVEFKQLAVSKKDGNPFVLYAWRIAGGGVRVGEIVRELEEQDGEHTKVRYLSAQDGLTRFLMSQDYADIVKAVEAGQTVEFGFAQGHLMRTSVQFRLKVENALKPSDRGIFGDAVYIHGALNAWTKAIVSVLHSMHPAFPAQDYDAHHYVVALRQAEVGMNRNGEKAWSRPGSLAYDVASSLLP
ncbi:hypothetical protein F6X40_24095 [Paraburkholderia sp. UCT31]|uniref:hypothetical protein n=1 Tax=Paraburkholderia sp. UCT31 TaxID=2615209 RepID=UPI0016558A76|nr:hypothetical protein [Paraburkholderia sp. UCT31]MBC8739799.1 hypothetical protein [Paraburkholderia sp. UCT31]